MNYGLLFVFLPITFGGLWIIWVSVRQLRLNNYLREQGTRTLAVITQTRLSRGKDKWGLKAFNSRFEVTYQDAQNRSYDADFSAKDSSDGSYYPVGGEVWIYYDPLYPERPALEIDVTSPLSLYWNALTGAGIIAFSIYLLLEVTGSNPFK